MNREALNNNIPKWKYLDMTGKWMNVSLLCLYWGGGCSVVLNLGLSLHFEGWSEHIF